MELLRVDSKSVRIELHAKHLKTAPLEQKVNY